VGTITLHALDVRQERFCSFMNFVHGPIMRQRPTPRHPEKRGRTRLKPARVECYMTALRVNRATTKRANPRSAIYFPSRLT
jgi:hypothetical protein